MNGSSSDQAERASRPLQFGLEPSHRQTPSILKNPSYALVLNAKESTRTNVSHSNRNATNIYQTPSLIHSKRKSHGSQTPAASSWTDSCSNSSSKPFQNRMPSFFQSANKPSNAASSANAYVYQTPAPHNYTAQDGTPHPENPTSPSAADLARTTAAHAGFLCKLGSNIAVYKRRFFVLQPGTHLYYFLSANDTHPRGCLDVAGSTLQELGLTKDGRFQFALEWKNTNNSQQQRVAFEAPNEEIGREWMELLRTQRLDYCQEQLERNVQKNSALKSRLVELEQMIANYRLVEKDRDDAALDAKQWRRDFTALDNAAKLLTRQLLRPTTEATTTTNNSNDTDNGADSGDNNASFPSDDDSIHTKQELDSANVPGTHFHAIYNACLQLQQRLALTSDEASVAVQDLTAAHAAMRAANERLGKTERHVCELWQDNCGIRKELKQKKRERRVLIEEVKQLRQQLTVNNNSQRTTPRHTNDVTHNDGEEAESSCMASDDEKLIQELEDHVNVSIQLHERMLALGSNVKKAQVQLPILTEDNLRNPRADANGIRTDNSLHQQPIASLFDDESDEDASVEHEEADALGSVGPSISSLAGVELGDGTDIKYLKHKSAVTDRRTTAPFDIRVVDISSQSCASTPERPNPLTLLDCDDIETAPNLCAASSQSESSSNVKYTITTGSGQATSSLTCPLADVAVGTRNNADTKNADELDVYHLTFYSRKIGLQFQKVPPPPTRPKGLLTEAMKSDLSGGGGVNSGSDRTAAELRRIATITTWAKSDKNQTNDYTLQVATPVDAVLVCGFAGFDGSGDNVKPKLGARLVAFDGVSVEVGRWTFESIRKSIQARDRPLTLSFRNDFLTTEQRAILTKAVKDVEKHSSAKTTSTQPPAVAIHRRRPSIDPSMHSALTTESDLLAYQDDLSVSVAGSDSYRLTPLPQSFSSARSHLSSGPTFRSFSEAGSTTSAFSAAAGAVVSNLLRSSGRNSEPFTPDYLRRAPKSVEGTPQHQDFKSELL
jgi:hypothetical protein